MTHTQVISDATRAALSTLMLLPDEVVLSMATREFDMGDNKRCLLGWAWNAALERETDLIEAGPEKFSNKYGGTYREWGNLFMGVCYDGSSGSAGKLDPTTCLIYNMPSIEHAFVLRLELAVSAQEGAYAK